MGRLKTKPAIMCDDCRAIIVFDTEAEAEMFGEDYPCCKDCGGDNSYIDAIPSRIESGYYN